MTYPTRARFHHAGIMASVEGALMADDTEKFVFEKSEVVARCVLAHVEY